LAVNILFSLISILRGEMERRLLLERLVQELGGRFSTSLSIDLSHTDPSEVFKWFLASILYGARISVDIATKTYKEFERRSLLTPKAILDAGWDGLVEALDAGGYTRYDFKTATKLLTVVEELLKRYDGDLNKLHRSALDPRDLERRLKDLGKGIGDVTVNIFLRELRGLWEKADPLPSSLEILAAQKLGLIDPKSGGE